ncbi:MAG: hypothetical protein GTO22_13265 [Gemmatimonadales bacterium]|nr:hypothetical protein [Gemmatimonadales bacterium]
MANDQVTCAIHGATLILTQQGLAFDGTMGGAQLTCSILPDTITLDSLLVVDGYLRGDSLGFRFNSAPLLAQWSHHGRVVGDSIGGIVTVSPAFCDPGPCLDLVLVGTWGAIRVP